MGLAASRGRGGQRAVTRREGGRVATLEPSGHGQTARHIPAADRRPVVLPDAARDAVRRPPGGKECAGNVQLLASRPPRVQVDHGVFQSPYPSQLGIGPPPVLR